MAKVSSDYHVRFDNAYYSSRLAGALDGGIVRYAKQRSVLRDPDDRRQRVDARDPRQNAAGAGSGADRAVAVRRESDGAVRKHDAAAAE